MYNLITYCQTTTLALEVSKKLLTAGDSLSNKYLYLGPHGAKAWIDVETSASFRIKSMARDLLKNYFQEIFDMVLEVSGEKAFDVVSLGTGTGHDDDFILEELRKKTNEEINLYLIDLSLELLQIGADYVNNNKAGTAYRDATQIHAICIDIEDLSTLQKYFNNTHKKNKFRLYHLLGLTLGNNNELDFLTKIAKGMSEGDFLLLSLDFCLDRNKWEKFSIGSYEKSQLSIQKFLSCPLKTAIETFYNGNNVLSFKGLWSSGSSNEYDYIHNPFQIKSRLM